MGELTADQIYSVFGDLTKAQQSQQQTLEKIEQIVSEKFADITNSFAMVKEAIASLTKSNTSLQSQQKNSDAVIQDVAETIIDNQVQQIAAAHKLNKTLTSNFRAMSSAFLTKENTEPTDQRQTKKKEQKVQLPKETEESKQLKMTKKELVSLNTKMGILVKDFQDVKKEKKDGGLVKFLSPLLLLFGGVAALAYATQKFPFAKKLLDQLKQGGIKQALSGLLGKIKPNDKTVTEWLRGMPFIGRFFDIYDAFNAFTKGNWKQGLKHLAFAIPGAEFIIDILGTSKKAFLNPGGGKQFIKNFSIRRVYDSIYQKISDVFSGITGFFQKIQTAFVPMMGGTWDGINSGLTALSDYFPILTPVVNFLKGITDAVFESSIAGSARGKKPDALGKITLVDIAKETFTKIYDGISSFFQKIAVIFDQVGVFLTAIGDVFSGDYGKQAMALSTIEKFSPGMGGFLRTALNVADGFRQLDIKEGDSLSSILWKLGTQGIQTTGRFSKDATFSETQRQREEQIKAAPEGSEQRAELEKEQKKAALSHIKESKQADQKKKLAELNERYRPAHEVGAYAGTINKRFWQGAEMSPWETTAPITGLIGAGTGLVEQMAYTVSDIYYNLTDQWDKRNESFYTEQKAILEQTQPEIDKMGERIKALETNKKPSVPLSSVAPATDSFIPSENDIKPLVEAKEQASFETQANFSQALENSNKPVLQQLGKLNLLEDIALKLGVNAEHLAAIEKSNANMEKTPSTTTNVMQGGTSINFGGGSTSNRHGRSAFDPQAFSLV